MNQDVMIPGISHGQDLSTELVPGVTGKLCVCHPCPPHVFPHSSHCTTLGRRRASFLGVQFGSGGSEFLDTRPALPCSVLESRMW